MLRRFSIATRLFGIVVLVVISAGVSLALVVAIAGRLEQVVVRHSQEIMLDDQKTKIKAAAHSMALALGEALNFAGDDFDRKRLALAIVNPVRFEDDASGYFFVYQGTVNVALPPRPGLQGKDLGELTDRDGVHYVRELYRSAAGGGGFVTYFFPKPGGPEERKISYAEMIPGTDLWVGTGVYLDNVDRESGRITGVIAVLFNQALAATGAVFAVMVGILSILCLAIAHSVARPMAEATLAAERIASGDLDVRLDEAGRDEAARLQAALNRMADTLGRNIEEIQARREEAEDKARQAELALEEARRAGEEVMAQIALRIESLQKISSAVAHQLRNPTTIIGGLAGLLMKKPSLRESYLEYLDGIIEAAIRIEHITAAVKEYSSIHLGSVSRVRAEDILSGGLEAGCAAAGELGKDVTWEVDPGGAEGDMDAALMRMALAEVTVNAVEALPAAGGRVRLSARSLGGGVVFTVADNGPGIAGEELEYVLDPFYTTKPVGVGMGLTKANRAAQEHGGGVAIQSVEGEGTAVTLTVPGR